VTFTDLFGKVIYCATSYSSLEEKKTDKKRRLSVFAIEDIISKLFPSLFFSEVNEIIIITRIKANFIISAMFRQLRFHGLKVFGYIREFVNPHNGVRLKRAKRR